jgi:3-dehydroquinate synthase
MELAFSASYKTELIFSGNMEDVFADLPRESFFIVDNYFQNSDWLRNCSNFFILKGEESKDLSTFERGVEWLSDMKADRNSTIVGIGGGSVTDFSGFLASVFNRGVRLVLVPTTLLAAIDSAIGGKTGLNYVAKNIVGSFYPAEKVVVCEDFFKSLSVESISSGKAEMIKVSMLTGSGLSELFEKGVDAVNRDGIEMAIADKYHFAGNDMADSRGTRIYLNWGHTFGHAIERCYGLPHGIAVATGMVMIQKYVSGFVPLAFDPDLLEKLLKINGIEVDPDLYLKKFREWLGFVKYDKKRDKEEISMVYLKEKGYPDIIKRSLEEITKDLEELK